MNNCLTTRSVRRKREEGGFALLMVFVLAATIAITLYVEMPRVAFESQRTKEQTLVDRGNQYKRAIQIFYRKNKRYPATMDELESFQNVRYLRRKYKDPFTGKDEWRIIHVGPGGQLTDSLIKKANPLGPNGEKDKDSKETADASNPGFQPNGSATNGQPDPNAPIGGMNMATARRPSDRILTGVPGQGGMLPTGDQDPNQPAQPVYPNQNTAQQYPTYPGQPAQLGQGGQMYPGQTGTYPQPYQTGQIMPGQTGQMVPTQFNPNQVIPGQTYPGQNGQPYSYPTGQFNQNLPYANPNNPNAPSSYNPNGGMNPTSAYNPNQPNQGQYNSGQQQPNSGSFNSGQQTAGTGANFGGQQNPAVNAIQQALFAPRPAPSALTGSSGMGGMSGGGTAIAGVASTYKGPSIKVINERKKYQEWEFVYDLKNDKSVMGNAGQMANMQNQQTGVNPGFGSSSGTGTGTGFGGSGGQGSTGFGSSGSQGSPGFGSGSTPQPLRQP